MSLISVDYFNNYVQDTNSTDDAIELKTDLINSAQDIIEQYISYPITIDDYIFSDYAVYDYYIKADAPIESITLCKVNEVVTTDYIIKGAYLYFKEKIKGKNIFISYKGGFTIVPSVFKVVCCKIASLLFMETNKGIGVTGKTLSDGMSHQYINYTNYNKHLALLNKYRISKL